jgi:hypothetical protein
MEQVVSSLVDALSLNIRLGLSGFWPTVDEESGLQKPVMTKKTEQLVISVSMSVLDSRHLLPQCGSRESDNGAQAEFLSSGQSISDINVAFEVGHSNYQMLSW